LLPLEKKYRSKNMFKNVKQKQRHNSHFIFSNEILP